MTLHELQQAIDHWMSGFEEGYWPPLANLARLTEEVGELARELNHAHGPKKRKASEPEGDIGAELGDILFTVATLANSLDLDLSRIATETLERVTTRDRDRWRRRETEPSDVPES